MRQGTHIPGYNAVKISVRTVPVKAVFCTMQGRLMVAFVHLRTTDNQFKSAHKSDNATHCSLLLPRRMELLTSEPGPVVSASKLESDSPSRS